MSERLASFFAATARHTSKQLSERLAHEGAVGKTADDTKAVFDEGVRKRVRISKEAADYVGHPVDREMCADCSMFQAPTRCTLVEGSIVSQGHCRYWELAETLDGARKSSDHPGGADLHVLPENAEKIHGIPIADFVSNANVMHVSWEMVREGKVQTKRVQLPLDSLTAIQFVVDRERVFKHEIELRETGKIGKNPPLVLLWDNDYWILSGHHGLQAAYDLRLPLVEVDLMVAPD